jgi:subtilisin family serine protease
MSVSLFPDRPRRAMAIFVTTSLIALGLSGPMTALAGTAAVPGAGGSSATVSAAAAQEKVIITFKARPGTAANAAVKAAGGTVTHQLGLIKGLSAVMPAKAVNGLRRNPLVASIELDGQLEAFADPPTGDLEYDNAWGVRHIGAYPVHQAGIRGAGVKVAIIDTGLDYIHDQPPSAEPPVVDPEFTSTYKGGYDFVNNDPDPMDDNGHGTHVAGILAAEHNGYLVVGVAPAVDLYALKVLGASGSGDYSGLIAALGWAVDHHIDVVNISLGGHDASPALQAAVTAAYNGGVTMVAASGNVVTFQDLLYGCPVAYPAAYNELIAVSYTGSTDQLTGYSCTGPQVDLAAPGDQIPSTVPVGTCMFCSPNGYAFESGTSMASPHVAGVAALLVSYGIADSNGNGIVADDIKAQLCATAKTASYPARTDSRYPNWYGCGIVDAANALLTNPPPHGGPVNHPPLAVADGATLAEDAGPTTIDVLANDSDPDPGTTLTVTAVTDPPAGTAAMVNGGASVTYTPDPNANGTDTFGYTVSDGMGRTASALVTVTVTAVNDPPVATDDTLVTVRDTAAIVKVLANDMDADGDTLSTVSVSSPDHGDATIQVDGSIAYAPVTGYSGPDGFDYTVSDGTATDIGHVAISVLAFDQPPVAVDDTLTTSEDAAASVAVLANDTDPDLETLTAASVTQPAHGTASINADGTMLYTPSPNYNGPDAFGYSVADGAGMTDDGAVSVTVTPANDRPTANDDSASTAEDTAVTIPVLANDSDIDGDSLTVTVTSPGEGTTTVAPDGTVSYTPPRDFYGSDAFGYTISDGAGGTAGATVSIAVSAVNDTPTVAPKTVSTTYQKAVAVTMTGADVETCDLTFQIVNGPAHGSLGAIANSLCVTLLPPYADSARVTYTPAAGYSGPDSFTYRASDGNLWSQTVTVSITVGDPVRMHVGDLDGSKTQATSTWTAKVTILVHNGSEAPVSGVTVTGTWSNGTTGTVTCKTAANGLCTVSKASLANATASVTFTVTGLTLTNAVYQSAANHDPEADSNGTTIIVFRQ